MKSKELNNQIIELLEVKLNSWANSICHRYKINRDSFRITIKQHPKPKPTRYGYVVQDGSYLDYMKDEHTVLRPKRTYIESSANYQGNQTLATISNGPVVLITVYVPLMDQSDNLAEGLKKTVKRMQVTVRGLFKYLSNPRVHRDDELFNPLIIGDTIHEYSITNDQAKVWRKRRFNPQVINGRSKSEFSVDVKRIVTVKHKETGIEYEVVDDNNLRQTWDLMQEGFEKCSEIVNRLMSKIEIAEVADSLLEENMTLVPIRYYQDIEAITNQFKVK